MKRFLRQRAPAPPATSQISSSSLRITVTSRLENLRLHQFRNYSALDVDFHPTLNIVAGKNAQGKTNLIEAIACMAMTRSPRAATLSEVMQWGALETAIAGTVQRRSGETTMEMRLHRETDDSRV